MDHDDPVYSYHWSFGRNHWYRMGQLILWPRSCSDLCPDLLLDKLFFWWWDDPHNDWRKACREHHGELVNRIMADHGYGGEDIAHVVKLIKKEQLKKDRESQALENVVDVVFIDHYFDEFIAKSPSYSDEKIIDILGKTLRKMSPKGHQAALALDLPERTRALVMAAVAREADTLAKLAQVSLD